MLHLIFLYFILIILISSFAIALLSSVYLRKRSKLLLEYIIFYSFLFLSFLASTYFLYYRINIAKILTKPKYILYFATFSYATLTSMILHFFTTAFYSKFKKLVKYIIPVIFAVFMLISVIIINVVSNSLRGIFTDKLGPIFSGITVIFPIIVLINYKKYSRKNQDKTLFKYILVFSIFSVCNDAVRIIFLYIGEKRIMPFIVLSSLMAWAILNIIYSIKYLKSSHKPGKGTISKKFIDEFRITKRENELISLITTGLSNQEIADELSISINTVKTYLYNLFQKTSVKNRTSLINLINNY